MWEHQRRSGRRQPFAVVPACCSEAGGVKGAGLGLAVGMEVDEAPAEGGSAVSLQDRDSYYPILLPQRPEEVRPAAAVAAPAAAAA
jgi:hypothetical protein